ncbi:MAG: ABC transporter ATP-binding protein [Clostridium sp.]|nr:ABC transporter ATP-binding protein [Clostridium sp.]
MDTILKIKDFSLSCKGKKILDNINMSVSKGEILALVGESGSGKSMLARSILRLNNPGIFDTEGEIFFEDQDINSLTERQLTKIRGARIGMIFQEPLSYLNPVFKMAGQLTEPLKKHKKIKKSKAAELMEDLLRKLNINNPEQYMKSYPHQLSGGMAQRGVIAMTSSCEPELIIADEPTSSLDVIVQLSIIKLIKDLARFFGVAVIFITHDLQLAAKIADRVAVISKGRIVEEGDVQEVLKNPKSEETAQLLNACIVSGGRDTDKSVLDKSVLEGTGTNDRVKSVLEGTETNDQAQNLYEDNICADVKRKALLEIRDLKMHYKNGQNINRALEGVSLTVYEGETLGLLGESGCGKSTLSRIITRIQRPTSGEVLFDGKDIFTKSDYPKDVQMIFQDSTTSMNPQMRVEDIVAEGMDILCKKSRQERTRDVIESLERVGLDKNIKDRFPHQLSGGQRQRVGIARALITNPRILICDEPTSYLDTVSQKHMLDLFMKLKNEINLTYIFITHNIRILGNISDRIAVMHKGRIVEIGTKDEIEFNPIHPYTKMLINASITPKKIQ